MPAQYNAADYDGWALTTLQSVGIGAGNIQLNQPYITVAGRKVQPFSVGSSLLIDNLTAQETAVLTAVTAPRSNSFLRLSATFAKAHGAGVLVRSATAGLQEAVNDASNQGGGLVVIDQTWQGSTSMIALLTGNTTVGLLDIRNGGLVSMTWNGSAYAAASGSLVQTAIVTLSAAEILDLVNTPKQLLAAPGANKFYRVISADLVYLAGSHPYGDAGNTRAFVTFINPALVNATEFDIGNWFSHADNRLNQSSVYNDNANGGNNADPLIDSVNKPLLLTGEGSGLLAGPILTSVLGAGGSGYAANDTGTIDGGTGGTYRVLTVDGGGAVLTYSITAAGLAYPTGLRTTAVSTGGGDGVFTINATSVQTGNGTAVLFLGYVTQTLP